MICQANLLMVYLLKQSMKQWKKQLHVRVVVEVPTHLNGAQRGKLQEFAASCDASVNPLSRGFFEKAKSFFR